MRTENKRMTTIEQKKLSNFFAMICNTSGEVPRTCGTCEHNPGGHGCRHPLHPMERDTWPRICSCGRVYDLADWHKLSFVGIQEGVYDMPDLELRNCQCGNTMSIPVELPKEEIK